MHDFDKSYISGNWKKIFTCRVSHKSSQAVIYTQVILFYLDTNKWTAN